MTKNFTYIIEHMEPDFKGWCLLEYANIARNVPRLILSKCPVQEKPSELEKVEFTTSSVNEWPVDQQKRVLLLDPDSKVELCPSDSLNYDFLLFGGILGDDPPQDRTRLLRQMGFETRHLGPVQMTTDTAVLVAQQIIEFQKEMKDLRFIDRPEIKLGKNSVVELPFRYIADENGAPKLPPGLVELIKEENDTPFEI